MPEISELEPAAAHRAAVAGEVTLVDVREAEEWDEARPDGAVHFALSRLPAEADGLPVGPIAFSCRSGKRSLKAAGHAAAAGRTDISNVTGGLQAWTEAGLPVITAPTAKDTTS